jgi:hypothetical protein
MQINEQIIIRRLPSGLYSIEREGQPNLVGQAASTATTLMTLVFLTEATETPAYIQENK